MFEGFLMETAPQSRSRTFRLQCAPQVERASMPKHCYLYTHGNIHAKTTLKMNILNLISLLIIHRY